MVCATAPEEAVTVSTLLPAGDPAGGMAVSPQPVSAIEMQRATIADPISDIPAGRRRRNPYRANAANGSMKA